MKILTHSSLTVSNKSTMRVSTDNIPIVPNESMIAKLTDSIIAVFA